MQEEIINTIGGQDIKNKDLSPEQQHHKNHVLSLRNKIAKLQFEIDELTPSLQFYENSLIATTQTKEDEASEEDK